MLPTEPAFQSGFVLSACLLSFLAGVAIGVFLGGLLFHATNVAPDRLELVNGRRFMLRPSRKPTQWGNTKFVYGSLSNDPSLPISFVEVHNGKRFVSLAREQPASNALYLYILDQRHAQYEAFHQVYRRGGIITQAMRFFARCRRPVNVAPGTPGVAVLRIFWKEGAPMDPHVEVVYGQVEIPTMPLPQCIAELRAMYARELEE